MTLKEAEENLETCKRESREAAERVRNAKKALSVAEKCLALCFEGEDKAFDAWANLL